MIRIDGCEVGDLALVGDQLPNPRQEKHDYQTLVDGETAVIDHVAPGHYSVTTADRSRVFGDVEVPPGASGGVLQCSDACTLELIIDTDGCAETGPVRIDLSGETSVMDLAFDGEPHVLGPFPCGQRGRLHVEGGSCGQVEAALVVVQDAVLSLHLSEGALWSLSVVDSISGEPVSGAHVVAWNGGPGAVFLTDDQGRVVVDGPIGGWVRFEAAGYATGTLQLSGALPDGFVYELSPLSRYEVGCTVAGSPCTEQQVDILGYHENMVYVMERSWCDYQEPGLWVCEGGRYPWVEVVSKDGRFLVDAHFKPEEPAFVEVPSLPEQRTFCAWPSTDSTWCALFTAHVEQIYVPGTTQEWPEAWSTEGLLECDAGVGHVSPSDDCSVVDLTPWGSVCINHHPRACLLSGADRSYLLEEDCNDFIVPGNYAVSCWAGEAEWTLPVDCGHTTVEPGGAYAIECWKG